jgi:HD-GYP domain-containing protein (c-di-GMP phosphodiesterase class II)
MDSAATPAYKYPGLRNCIACTITHDQRLMGWLVACNKIRLQRPLSEDGVHWGLDDSGTLSTFGAGLLQNCAGMLAAYGSSLEHIAAQEASLTGIIHCIVNALEAKDQYTCGHSGRVALYATVIAEQLGFEPAQCREIHMTGLLHDVGKIGVPDSILGKPDRLTEEEFEVVKQHPQIGYDILRHIDDFSYVLPGVLHHHEAFNGSGYPHRLVGEAIPLAGRILAVADAYDAMTSDRPYRKGMPHAKAEGILREERGKMWDPQVVDAFLACWASGKLSPHAPPAPSTPDLPLTDAIPISPWRLELSALSASL